MDKLYRKKTVIIEAVQYTEYGKLVKGICNSQSCYCSGNTEPHVHTIHKGQIVNLQIGDWIIPETDGEHFYPCKPDIFEATYEPANHPEAVERVTDKPMERWEFEYLLSEYASGREQLNSLREGLKSDASKARIIPEVDKRVKEIKARLLSALTTPAPIPVDRLEAGRYLMTVPVDVRPLIDADSPLRVIFADSKPYPKAEWLAEKHGAVFVPIKGE